MTFLTIITRHLPSRDVFLAANRASLAAQTDRDFDQQVLVDHEYHGVAWANYTMRQYAGAPVGEFVLMLDDDDILADAGTVAALHAVAPAADLIVARVDHGPGPGVLPKVWGQLPPRDHIGGSSVVCRREVWQQAAAHWGYSYAGDYDFIQAAFGVAQRIVWLDRIIVRVQRISRGRP
jgi:hypothetical protein